MDIANEVLRILDERGPSSLSDVVADLRERDGTLTPTRIAESLPADALLVHEEYLVRESWLFDRVFTHRLTDAEAASDMVAVMPDFALVLNALDPGVEEWVLTDGTQVTTLLAWLEPPDGFEVPDELYNVDIIFAFPPGTFRGAGRDAGDLVGLRYGPGGFTLEAPEVVERGAARDPGIPRRPAGRGPERRRRVAVGAAGRHAGVPRSVAPRVGDHRRQRRDSGARQPRQGGRSTATPTSAGMLCRCCGCGGMSGTIKRPRYYALQELSGATLHLPGVSAVRSPDEVPFDPALIALRPGRPVRQPGGGVGGRLQPVRRNRRHQPSAGPDHADLAGRESGAADPARLRGTARGGPRHGEQPVHTGPGHRSRFGSGVRGHGDARERSRQCCRVRSSLPARGTAASSDVGRGAALPRRRPRESGPQRPLPVRFRQEVQTVPPRQAAGRAGGARLLALTQGLRFRRPVGTPAAWERGRSARGQRHVHDASGETHCRSNCCSSTRVPRAVHRAAQRTAAGRRAGTRHVDGWRRPACASWWRSSTPSPACPSRCAMWPPARC